MKKHLKIILLALIAAISVLSLVACSAPSTVDGISINSSYSRYDTETIDVTLTARNNNASSNVVAYSYRVDMYRSGYLVYSNTYSVRYTLTPGESRTEYITLTASSTGTSLAEVNRVSVTPVTMEIENSSDNGSTGSDSGSSSGGSTQMPVGNIPSGLWIPFVISVIMLIVWLVLAIICGATDEEEMGTAIMIIQIVAVIPAIILALYHIGSHELAGMQWGALAFMAAAFGLGIGAINVGKGAIEAWIVVVGSIGMTAGVLGFLSLFLSALIGPVLFWIFGIVSVVFTGISLYIDIRGEDYFL